MRYLLDTNIISDLIRNPQGPAARRLAELGDRRTCTSVIVASELWYGAFKLGSQKLTDRLEAALSAIDVIEFGPPAERMYGELRARLEGAGMPLSGNDLLIAAQTIALGFTLVSDNEREFARVPGLALVNWLR